MALDMPSALVVLRSDHIPGVVSAIELDHETRLHSDEIDDEQTDRMLPPELHAEKLP